MQKRSIFSLIFLGLLAPLTTSAATIVVNTTSMTVDVAGAEIISQDSSTSPAGRSGLYSASSLTVADLSNTAKNPSDAESGSAPAISLPEAIIAANSSPDFDEIVLEKGKVYNLLTVNNYWYGANALPPLPALY